MCTHNGTKISWRHIFEVIWGHLGTFEGSQLIRLIVVIIEDGGKSGDAPIILEPGMTPRPRLSRLVAHLRNPMRSKTLSRRVTLNPFTRSDLGGSDLRSDDCSAAPWVELKHVLALGPWGHLESHKDATSVDAHTSHLHLWQFGQILVEHLTRNNRSLLQYYYYLFFCKMYACLWLDYDILVQNEIRIQHPFSTVRNLCYNMFSN